MKWRKSGKIPHVILIFCNLRESNALPRIKVKTHLKIDFERNLIAHHLH